MKFERAKYKIIDQKPGLNGIFKTIEYPGRICYGSQDRITDESAEPFVQNLISNNHLAPLEHGTVYLEWNMVKDDYDHNRYNRYKHNAYSKVVGPIEDGMCYVTTNYRVIIENNWEDDLKFICDVPNDKHIRRVCVEFILDRFTGEEFLRHRKGSFNRESTRFINFLRDKFGSGSISFILPPWINESKFEMLSNEKYVDMCAKIAKERTLKFKLLKFFGLESKANFSAEDLWQFSLKTAENVYCELVSKGWQPQQARTVLPCAIKSPLVMTAFIDDWKHFFNLRSIGTTGKPHPQAYELATPLMREFIEHKYIEDTNESYN